MGKALEAVKELELVNEKIKTPHKVVTRPKFLEDLIKKLSIIVGGVPDIPSPQSVEDLFEKTKELYLQESGQLTTRERRNLPFILPYACDVSGMVDFVITQIDFTKFSVFKRVLFVYFNNYGNRQITPKLRDELLRAIREDERKKNISYLGKNAEFLSKQGPQKMAVYFTRGLTKYLDEICLPVALKTSRFVHQAIIYYFSSVKDKLANKIELLKQLSENDTDKILLPHVSGPLILDVHASGNLGYRDSLISILHQAMGDPRYANQTAWSWVDKKAKDIFISWLKRGDLDLFFAIIDRTMHDYDDDRMWQERKTFWENHLDEMYYTKVVLAPEAVRIARREYPDKILDYGRLDSSNKNQSLFVFNIGKYVFSEASHNGTLRIWRWEDSPVQLDSELRRKVPINYSDDIVNTYSEVETFRHSGYWQNRVNEWIFYHCS